MQGAYVRKSLPLTLTVLHTLSARARAGYNQSADSRWLELENQSENEVAKVLQDSLIFLFPNAEEGLGRIPLEALLSGCIVISSDVGPANEYVPATLRFAYADVIAMVSAIERLISPDADLGHIQDEVIAGRVTALRYSAECQRTSICEAWERLLQRF